MADASPKDLEIVEVVELIEEDKEILTNGEETEQILPELTVEDTVEDTNDPTPESQPEDSQSSDREVNENGEENNNEEGDSNKGDDNTGASTSNGNNKKPDDCELSEVDFTVGKSDTSSTDAKSIRSRVFIGHLNTSRASRQDLLKLFGECGKVVAISILDGYGFVQFDSEESARKSIRKIHGKSLHGMKLVVDKPAAWKKLEGEKLDETRPWPSRSSRDDDDRHHRHRHHRSERSERRRDRERRRDSDSHRHHSHHSRYYDDIPPRYHDPYYERYLEIRYMEERLTERYRASEADRYYERYPPPSGRYPPPPPSEYYRQEGAYRTGGDYREQARGTGAGYYPEYEQSLMSHYDRPRDDEYDRRRPFDSYYH